MKALPQAARVRKGALALLLALGLCAATTAARAEVKPFNVVPLTVSGLSLSANATGGLFYVNGMAGADRWRTPLLISTSANPSDSDCPIVKLQVGNISVADPQVALIANSFCLTLTPNDSTAFGSLVCQLGTALSSGVHLDTFLGTLNASQLSTLTSGITQLIRRALAPLTTSTSIFSAACGTTDTLYFRSPAQTLNYGGVSVAINNCRSATGMLNLTLYAPDSSHLGMKICHLRTLWGANASPNAIQANLQEIGRLIHAGLGIAPTHGGGDDEGDDD